MAVVLGRGIYSFSEAATLTGLKPSRVREWFRGKSGEVARRPVFSSDYEPVNGEFAVSFLDLIDVYVAGRLRDHGASLQTLRRVYGRMKELLNTEHPFCKRELLSDGKTVFLRAVDEAGREEIVEALTSRGVFPQIIKPFLKKIDYEQVTALAERWHIADQVVVDPALCFGKPVVEGVGIKTAILAAAYQANGKKAEAVADWYGIHPCHVLAAVTFEKSLAASGGKALKVDPIR
jgi:uncharacterized protein (DUF433 family)